LTVVRALDFGTEADARIGPCVADDLFGPSNAPRRTNGCWWCRPARLPGSGACAARGGNRGDRPSISFSSAAGRLTGNVNVMEGLLSLLRENLVDYRRCKTMPRCAFSIVVVALCSSFMDDDLKVSPDITRSVEGDGVGRMKKGTSRSARASAKQSIARSRGTDPAGHMLLASSNSYPCRRFERL